MRSKTLGLMAVAVSVAAGSGLQGCSPDDNLIGSKSDGLAMDAPALAHFQMENFVERLVLPNDNEAVVVFDSNGDPDEIAAAYEIDIIEIVETPDGLLVRYDIPTGFDFTALRHEEGVTGADPNAEVFIGEVQTLLVGFLEGGFNQEAVDDQEWLNNLNLRSAHAVATGDDVRVAVIDTGAYSRHPLLRGRTVELPDDSGFESEEYKDHIDQDEDGELDEGFGHGTHVAGCVALVAPGAQLVPIRAITDDGVGSLWDIVKALKLALAMDADVINLSISVASQQTALDAVLEECWLKGVAVIAAAGNYGNEAATYPATSPYTLGVAAVTDDDELLSWSGSGNGIAVAAPGELILSGYPRAEAAFGTGTSMATPIVSGSVALAIEAHRVSPLIGARCVTLTSKPVNPTNAVEYGRVDPLQAVLEIGGDGDL